MLLTINVCLFCILATWWSLYGTDYPDLQRLAVRILSQTCSVVQCRKRCSMFNYLYLKKNWLEKQKMNDLAFAHYNLQLQERYLDYVSI